MYFLTSRIFRGLFTLFFIVSIVFFLTRIGGDPLTWLLPDDASPLARETMRARFGLDRPLYEQYFTYIKNAFRGDFGISYAYRVSVVEVFLEYVPRTIGLMSYSLLLSLLIGIPVGIIAALKRNSFLDRFLMMNSFLAYSVPHFVLGIMLILFFGLRLGWLPSGGYGGWRHFIMPVFAFGASNAGIIARLMRSSMLDVIRQDYIRTAEAKGLFRHQIIIKHALRVAIIPVVTMAALQIPKLIAGSFVIETVFSWPGAGRLIIRSARFRDFPVLQFSILVTATFVVILNIIVDLCYTLLDPRIKLY